MARTWASILLVALIAGCGPAPTSDTPARGTTFTAAPLPTIDQQGLVSGNLTCGDGNTFPAAALQGPGGAEVGLDAPAAGLRAVIAETGDPQVPDNGWHLVSLSPTKAQYVARGRGDSGWSVVALQRGPSGWTMDVAGDCRLTVVLGPGINPAPWWLDPAAGDLVATQTTLDVLVQETACASGRAPDGRIVAPVVVYQPDALVVAFGIVPLPGMQNCPGAPPGKYRVTLRQPLGNRRLLDGGVVPPRDATKPPN